MTVAGIVLVVLGIIMLVLNTTLYYKLKPYSQLAPMVMGVIASLIVILGGTYLVLY